MGPIDQPEVLWVGLATLVVLSIASVIGFLLSKQPMSDAKRDTVRNLNARIRSWWIMIGILGAAFVLGPTLTIVLFACASFLALREFITLIPTRRGDHRALFLAFFLVVPLQYALIAMDWYGVFSIFIPVYVFLGLPAVMALAGDTESFLRRASNMQWALMLCVYAISHAPALLLLDIPGYDLPPVFLLIFLITVVQLSDVLQYVFGKLLGRRKIAPSVSPSKTIEGLVGGGLTATLIGGGLSFLTPFTFAQALGMSATIVIAGFLGGLVLSAAKRDLGVKDWGRMIEGHGGILDRMDSVAFAAPLFFHMTRYWWA